MMGREGRRIRLLGVRSEGIGGWGGEGLVVTGREVLEGWWAEGEGGGRGLVDKFLAS